MASDKEIIKKLLKIAENQQKIITKIAQDMGGAGAEPMGGASSSWLDVSEDLQAKLSALPAAKGYSVSTAEVGSQSGSLKGKLVYPKGDTKFYEVVKALKSQLAGSELKTSDGKSVKVSANPQDISFIGMT